MPVAGGGFDQCYNAQAAVAAESLLVVAAHVVQAPTDKQQLLPSFKAVAPQAGPVAEVLIDSGFFGRILSVRGEFGYWVFTGEDQVPTQRPRERESFWRRLPGKRQPLQEPQPLPRQRQKTQPRSRPWHIAYGRPKEKSSTAYASRPRNRSSASSNR